MDYVGVADPNDTCDGCPCDENHRSALNQSKTFGKNKL